MFYTMNHIQSVIYCFKAFPPPQAPNLKADIHYVCDFAWKTAALAWEYLLRKFIVHA